MKKQLFVIREGFSNAYLVHGVLALTLAAGSCWISLYLSLIFAVFAIVLFLAVTGVEIDPENHRYRKYSIISGVKLGKWIDFSVNDKVSLLLSSETMTIMYGGYATHPLMIAPTNFYNGNKSKTITYDIVREDEDGVRTIVNEFSMYKDAKSALSIFRQTGCNVRNRIAEKINENKNKRR